MVLHVIALRAPGRVVTGLRPRLMTRRNRAKAVA